MREYLIYCSDCHEYSLLGRFLRKKTRFEGEYSLLHNCHIESDELLCRFLIDHAGHAISTLSNHDENYSNVIKDARHYKEKDIEKYVSESIKRKQSQDQDLQMERGLGQLQLNILSGMLKEEVQSISKTASNASAESQFLLGKEDGLKKAQELLSELMEKTNTLYKTS